MFFTGINFSILTIFFFLIVPYFMISFRFNIYVKTLNTVLYVMAIIITRGTVLDFIINSKKKKKKYANNEETMFHIHS